MGRRCLTRPAQAADAAGKVILPQALIVALRPYGNEVILMIKGSAGGGADHRCRPDGRDTARLLRSFDFSPTSGRH